MAITLNGRTYRAVRDPDGQQAVIYLDGRFWRLAGPVDTARILAGFLTSPLRMAL